MPQCGVVFGHDNKVCTLEVGHPAVRNGYGHWCEGQGGSNDLELVSFVEKMDQQRRLAVRLRTDYQKQEEKVERLKKELSEAEASLPPMLERVVREEKNLDGYLAKYRTHGDWLRLKAVTADDYKQPKEK